MKRRLAREMVLKVLFQLDIGNVDLDVALENVLEEEESCRVRDFVRTLVKGTVDNLPKIDQVINQFAHDWTVDRMAGVDRNLLRLAVYEVLFVDDIPSAVSINEAVELAKVYGTEESSKFINGILGNVVRNVLA